ncbi:MAG: serine/threonine protein kinase [Anaerolineae bacterium]|nr:serine/threonine protein kinase [Anaerolineae bacterium]
MADPNIGKKLGNYEITELIGKGGMAGVYKALQPSMNRTVAVKIMSQQFTGDELFVQRFKNEAELIAQLEHAHILPVYDFGEEDGTLYIVMRYLPSGTLSDRIKKGGMPLREAITIFSQIARALDYAHSNGVIHRDLKPGNILIDQQGNSFLSDFGIAKSLEQTLDLTGTGGVVGTPTYMSPEQGLGEPLDARSDIYSLGVLLFEMLTGKLPFEADNAMALMLKHINDAAPSPRALNPSIPLQIEDVILRALEKAPGDRFASAGEMVDMLENAQAVAIGATPPHGHVAGDRDTGGTVPVAAVSDSHTMPAPVAGRPQPETAPPQGAASMAPTVPDAAAVPIPTHAPQAPAAPGAPDYTINSISAWLARRQFIGTWLQGAALSAATFVALTRLTPGSPLENALLSVVPGLFLYSLLSAPIPGALISFGLIFLPLLAHAPALAALWLVMIVIAGAQMTSREMMVSIVTIILAGTPFAWLIPLAAPWWMSKHRMAFSVALGVIFGALFTLTLSWPNGDGLMPQSPDAQLFADAQLSAFDTSYLGLLEAKVWEPWFSEPLSIIENVRATLSILGDFFLEVKGLPLIIATAWALAALLTVSNRRGASPVMRSIGIVVGLIALVVGHTFHGWAGVKPPETIAFVAGGLMAVLAILFTQYPIQAPPLPPKKTAQQQGV